MIHTLATAIMSSRTRCILLPVVT